MNSPTNETRACPFWPEPETRPEREARLRLAASLRPPCTCTWGVSPGGLHDIIHYDPLCVRHPLNTGASRGPLKGLKK